MEKPFSQTVKLFHPEQLNGVELLTVLLGMSRQMAEMRSMKPLLSFLIDRVNMLVGAERGYIVLLKPDGSLDFKVRRFANGTDIESTVDSISSSILNEVIETKNSLVVRNASLDPRFSKSKSVMVMQLRSIMCTPLITQNQIIGAVYVENRSRSGQFSGNDVIPLEFFCNHAAVAIENANLYENLETLVEERTKELEEAKNAAESATRAKSAFLSNMTHELRTPMNGVLGMTTLLMDSSLDEDQKDIVDTIRASGDTLLTLINDILDFSKIEAEKLELEQVDFQLDNCIEEAIDLVTPLASNKGLHVGYVIDADVPLVLKQDVTRIRQILTNMLSNAVKFTEHGTVAVHVSLVEEAECLSDEMMVVFKVSDTGIGIPADRLERLFQPFSQVDSSTTRRFGGTGLGLIISKRLSELMGGTIGVESEEGVGTTFSFSICANRADATLMDEREGEKEKYRLFARKKIAIVSSQELVYLSAKQHLDQFEVVSESLAEMTPALKQYDGAIIDLTQATKDEVKSLLLQGFESPTLLLIPWGERYEISSKRCPVAITQVPLKRNPLLRQMGVIFDDDHAKGSADSSSSLFDTTLAAQYPLRILLAEDNVVNQKVAVRMLTRCGYTADVVSNGLEAVHAVQRTRYDVVLMDVQMPEMNGLEATARIRNELPKDRQPHIVAMTAHAMEEARKTFLNSGMDAFISKPVMIEELQTVLRDCSERLQTNVD